MNFEDCNRMRVDRLEALGKAAAIEYRAQRKARVACVFTMLTGLTLAAWREAHPLVYVGVVAGYFVLAFVAKIIVAQTVSRPLLVRIEREYPVPLPLTREQQDRILFGERHYPEKGEHR